MRQTGETEIQDQCNLKRYRTELPNILFKLGLTPYEFALYSYYKQAAGAGKDGRCTKGRDTLATETGMSAGMITKAKDGLKKRRKELGGRALITVTQRHREAGGKPLDIVAITDIWGVNFQQFSTDLARSPGDIDAGEARSPDDIARSPDDIARSPGDLARSPGDIKKEPVQERTNIRSTSTDAVPDIRASARADEEKTESKNPENSQPKEAVKKSEISVPSIALDDPLTVATLKALGITAGTTEKRRAEAVAAAAALATDGRTAEQVALFAGNWWRLNYWGCRCAKDGRAVRKPRPDEIRNEFDDILNLSTRRDNSHESGNSKSEQKLERQIVFNRRA